MVEQVKDTRGEAPFREWQTSRARLRTRRLQPCDFGRVKHPTPALRVWATGGTPWTSPLFLPLTSSVHLSNAGSPLSC